MARHLIGGPRLGLERGDPILDTLVVDARDGRGVRGPRQPTTVLTPAVTGSVPPPPAIRLDAAISSRTRAEHRSRSPVQPSCRSPRSPRSRPRSARRRAAQEALGHLAPRRVVVHETHATRVSHQARRRRASQRNSAVAAAAPTSCATMNPGASAGRMPANVSVAARASVTAGLANDVDAVNQYAAVMYAPPRTGRQPSARARSPR